MHVTHDKLHNERMHVMLIVREQFCSKRQLRRVVPVSILVDSLSRKDLAKLCCTALLGFPLLYQSSAIVNIIFSV